MEYNITRAAAGHIHIHLSSCVLNSHYSQAFRLFLNDLHLYLSRHWQTIFMFDHWKEQPGSNKEQCCSYPNQTNCVCTIGLNILIYLIYKPLKEQFTQKWTFAENVFTIRPYEVRMSLFLHQVWRDVALHQCLSNKCSVVNGCRQNESPNSWLKHHNDPHHSSPSVNVLRR